MDIKNVSVMHITIMSCYATTLTYFSFILVIEDLIESPVSRDEYGDHDYESNALKGNSSLGVNVYVCVYK